MLFIKDLMVPDRKFRFALAGCGYAGGRYIKLLSQHKKCELTALVDTNCTRLADYRNMDIPGFYSIEEFFVLALTHMQ